MFMGEYNHNIDTKGRIMLPSKFREEIGEEGFVITRGLDNCIFLYTKKEWDILEEKIKELPLTKKDARAFVRFMFSGAASDNCDNQGRIKIPETLIQYASIEKEVVITGALNRIEIWSKKNWEEYMKNAEESFEEIAENMMEF